MIFDLKINNTFLEAIFHLIFGSPFAGVYLWIIS